ncbi:type II secretion system protein N [Stenomitos frigidus]|uniref:Type II secretion system protein GspC N-terminal domain-containing protein n=1 Tax=Stenomitos frigidus ULC18 TaxID=2107698 RepID=A0A2T1E5W2_9CYAN|nr:type II secretion system protein N [Stenomitos frigidus]PSB28034.1 hypothetical protein C7B82_14360 [Stenomitos frigidus ULC18]
MSQDVSTSQRLLKSADAPPFSVGSFGSDVPEVGSFPVESYADRLMDDLFGDVERLLDSGAKLTTDPVPSDEPTPTSKAPKFNGFVDLVSPLMRRSELDASLAPDDQDDDALLAQDTSERSLTRKPLIQSVRESVRSYDRLLLGLGAFSLLAVLATWLLSQQAQRQVAPITMAPQTTTSNPAAANSATDNQFVSYLQQALKAIDQQQPSGAPSLGVNGLPSLPAIQLPGSPTIQTAPGTKPNSATRPSTGLSRLYVPIYQVPQPQSGSLSVSPLPSANTPTAVRPPIPLSMPGIPKKLVGVLELGDRSAALIEINGVAQRYRIGESIATSGWTLVEVSKDQAVIRRNGEVRSVFIGQNF